MKNFKFTINGNQYNVDITNVENNIVQMEVNGTHFEVEIARKVRTSKTPTLVRTDSPQPVKPTIERKEGGTAFPILSPLPGIIVEIFVKPGDIIKQGQKILSIEAMKMINQVLAEKEGVVESIKVAPGQNVLQGEILIEIV